MLTDRKMEEITPLGDRVIVIPDNPDKMYKGAIYIPDTAQDKNAIITGMVYRVGRGKWNASAGAYIPPDFKEGDRIIYGKYKADQYDDDGVDYAIVEAADIWAVIEGDPLTMGGKLAGMVEGEMQYGCLDPEAKRLINLAPVDPITHPPIIMESGLEQRKRALKKGKGIKADTIIFEK